MLGWVLALMPSAKLGGGVKATLFFTSLVALATSLGARPLQFSIVPVEVWNEPDLYSSHKLTGGEVAFYERDAIEPAFRVAAGARVDVPIGNWVFTVQAPGYIGLASGGINVSSACAAADASPLEGLPGNAGSWNEKSIEHTVLSAETTKEVYWWAVPACKVSLADETWSAADQIDFISLTFGVRYPFRKDTSELNVQLPAGDLLMYRVSAGQISGMSPVVHCEAGMTIPAPSVSLPPAGTFDLLLVSPSRDGVAGAPVLVSREAPSNELRPDLQAGNSAESIAVFRKVPSALRWQVVDPGTHEELLDLAAIEGGTIRQVTVDAGR